MSETPRPTFRRYADFWPHYLRQHRRPGTRRLHFAGSLLGLALLAAGLIQGPWWLIPLAPLVGYAFAWTAHFGLEGNRPASFGHPFWSFFSDFRMLGLWLTGRLERHLREAGV